MLWCSTCMMLCGDRLFLTKKKTVEILEILGELCLEKILLESAVCDSQKGFELNCASTLNCASILNCAFVRNEC